MGCCRSLRNWAEEGAGSPLHQRLFVSGKEKGKAGA